MKAYHIRYKCNWCEPNLIIPIQPIQWIINMNKTGTMKIEQAEVEFVKEVNVNTFPKDVDYVEMSNFKFYGIKYV